MREGLLPTSVRVKPDPTSDLSLLASHTLQEAVDLTNSARKALGKARLTTLTNGAEFMRVILGDDHTEVAAGGGYYCPACFTQPKFDYHWTKAIGCAALSGWFCASCGETYDTERMAGLITFVDKSNPDGSFVLNTRMPSGSVSNMLSAIMLTNATRQGEIFGAKEDATKAGRIGAAIKTMITSDDERYFLLMVTLRAVQVAGKLTEPVVDHGRFPRFQICEGLNDVILTSKGFGRGCVVYDVGKLFDKDDPAEPSASA